MGNSARWREPVFMSNSLCQERSHATNAHDLLFNLDWMDPCSLAHLALFGNGKVPTVGT